MPQNPAPPAAEAVGAPAGGAARQPIWRRLLHDRAWPWRLLRMALLFCILFVITMMFLENHYIYHPLRYPDGDNWDVRGYRVPPGKVGMTVEDVWLQSADGVRIHAWYFQPARNVDGALQPVPVRGAVLWCHGNAGNISNRYWRVEPLKDLDVAVLLFDYRGYGRSDGSPSEQGLYRDTQAAWDHLTVARGFPAEQIMIVGISLGGAPATELATRVRPAGLVLESTFTSIPDMARIVMPVMPSVFIRQRMDTAARIGHIACPLLIIHGDSDRTIPFDMGARLYAAAAEPKTFLAVPGADHDDLAYTDEAAYAAAYRRFFATCGLGPPELEPTRPDADSP